MCVRPIVALPGLFGEVLKQRRQDVGQDPKLILGSQFPAWSVYPQRSDTFRKNLFPVCALGVVVSMDLNDIVLGKPWDDFFVEHAFAVAEFFNVPEGKCVVTD
jgi:hypothetical protein